MRRIYLCLFTVLLFSGSVYAQEQIVVKPETPIINTESLQQPQRRSSNELIHKFVCQRCGSENQLNWAFPVDNKNLQLIPHCGFCGKKYWPKFKPTGMLQRTYCRAALPPGLSQQQRSLQVGGITSN
jgi:hypothetical protein